MRSEQRLIKEVRELAFRIHLEGHNKHLGEGIYGEMKEYHMGDTGVAGMS